MPIVSSITKSARTVTAANDTAKEIQHAVLTAMTPHRGPVFVDFPMDVIFDPASEPAANGGVPKGIDPDPADVEAAAALIAAAERPAIIVGSDVYWDGAWGALTRFAETMRVPCWFNGLGRGCLPADHELAFTRTRALLKSEADLVVVIGTALDFRLGFGRFGDAPVIHICDAPESRAAHVATAASPAGDLTAILDGMTAWSGSPRADHEPWIAQVRDAERAAAETERGLLEAGGDAIKPTRVYGELGKRLARDAVVICDGGDFVSYAGKYVEVYTPGCWLDTGPYGCLGNGPGYAMAARVARPDAQIVVMLGDGAAGFSLMDVDTLVRHNLPVVMVVGNNGMWGLEKYPMRAIYGYDVACDLQPGCRYDEVVTALGGAGETVSSPSEVGPALDRAFAAGVPYLVNVMTDPEDVYPRSSNLG